MLKIFEADSENRLFLPKVIFEKQKSLRFTQAKHIEIFFI